MHSPVDHEISLLMHLVSLYQGLGPQGIWSVWINYQLIRFLKHPETEIKARFSCDDTFLLEFIHLWHDDWYLLFFPAGIT